MELKTQGPKKRAVERGRNPPSSLCRRSSGVSVSALEAATERRGWRPRRHSALRNEHWENEIGSGFIQQYIDVETARYAGQ